MHGLSVLALYISGLLALVSSNNVAAPLPQRVSNAAASIPASPSSSSPQSNTPSPYPPMDSVIDFSDASRALDLDNIRFQLIRLEDTITYNLIERVQFPLSKTIYVPGGVRIPNEEISLMDYFLREQERLQSRVRRFESPDEYPFFPEAVEKPILQPLNYPKILHENTVNVNSDIKQRYIEDILPAVCPQFGREDRGEEQENYGSAATCDVGTLQALSRRIHFGKFVAESKFQTETDKFVQLIQAGDEEGIDKAITNAAVEQKVLERLALKAKAYGTDPGFPNSAAPKIDVNAVQAMYKEYVIPLTKKVEVEYLMQRLKGTQWE